MVEDWMAYYDSENHMIRVEPFSAPLPLVYKQFALSSDKSDAIERVKENLRCEARFLRMVAADLETVANEEAESDV